MKRREMAEETAKCWVDPLHLLAEEIGIAAWKTFSVVPNYGFLKQHWRYTQECLRPRPETETEMLHTLP